MKLNDLNQQWFEVLFYIQERNYCYFQGIEGDAQDLAISLLNDTTSKLTNAVSSLPELLEKKRLLDAHTNIATALLDQIKVIKFAFFLFKYLLFSIETKIGCFL
jgi:hypothetical protein